LKNAEEFVRIEQESHRSRFSKNKEGDDLEGSRHISHIHESISSKRQEKSLSSKFKASNQDNQDSGNNQFSNAGRKEKQPKTGQLIEESQQKFAQTSQNTQQRWANQANLETKTDNNGQ
jgi:hypothetical protein